MSDFQLYLGDCAEVLKTLDTGSVDLTVTSPPYDTLRKYKGYTFDFETIARELYRATKEGGVVVWVVNDKTNKGSETGTSFRQALYFMECGFRLHDTMIYKKICYVPMTHKRYEPSFEFMFILSKGAPATFNPRMKKNKGKGKITGNFRHDGDLLEPFHGKGKEYKESSIDINIWEYSTGWMHSYTEEFVKGHPAVFPEALARDHILSWSNEGDVVLDPMCGSATTGKMALLNNRNFIGIEISEEYMEIAKKRIEGIKEKA